MKKIRVDPDTGEEVEVTPRRGKGPEDGWEGKDVDATQRGSAGAGGGDVGKENATAADGSHVPGNEPSDDVSNKLHQRGFLTAVKQLKHVGSVWAVEADEVKVVTATADTTMRIFSAKTLRCLRKVEAAHKRTIRCFAIGPDTICSGGADFCIKVWDVESTYQKPFKYVRCHRRLRGGRHGGHVKPITEVQFAASELVSGDMSGLVIVWDIPTAVILRRIEAHRKSIRSLQFDATRIFCCSNDSEVSVLDITTGDILERFYNHKTPVLALAVDGKELLTVSARQIIHAYFDRSTDKESRRYHLLAPGESLGTLKKRYGVTISDLKQWNNIKDVALDVYLGMRMMVAVSAAGGIAFRQDMFRKKEAMYKEKVRKERLHRLKTAFKLENDLLDAQSGDPVSSIRDKLGKDMQAKAEKKAKAERKAAEKKERAERAKAEGREEDLFSDDSEEDVDPFAGGDSDSDSSSSSDSDASEDDLASIAAASSSAVAGENRGEGNSGEENDDEEDDGGGGGGDGDSPSGSDSRSDSGDSGSGSDSD